MCGSDSGGGGRFYLCTPTPSTWAHRGEQPPGAAGLGPGAPVWQALGPMPLPDSARGRFPCLLSTQGLPGTPLPALRLPERGQQGPALWDGGTRASAGLVEALGSPRALV